VGFAIYVFFWAVDCGQYDDFEGPAHIILFDEPPPVNDRPEQQQSGADRKHYV
ncbi:cbb3-type cytochrome oxidase assembly protein CcoS, partial [Pseudomonas syringae group genomosp. 7]